MAGRTAGLAVAMVVAAALLGACRSDEPTVSPDDQRPGTGPAPTVEGTDPASPRARSRVEEILLTPRDLGSGWRAQGNVHTATGIDGLAVLHECLADVPGTGGLLAAARSPSLLHVRGDAERTVVSSAAVVGREGASRLFTRMVGDAFATCVVDGLVADLTAAAGAARITETQLGPVQPYPGAGVEAVRAAAVVSVSDPETAARFDAFVHVLALREDDAVALLVTQSLFTDLPEEQIDAMARRLAGRLG